MRQLAVGNHSESLVNVEFPLGTVYEDICSAPETTNSSESDKFMAQLIKSDEMSESTVTIYDEIDGEIYEAQLNSESLDLQSAFEQQDETNIMKLSPVISCNNEASNGSDLANEVLLGSQNAIEFNELDSIEIYACELCKKNFESEQDLSQHFSEQHAKEMIVSQYECGTCNLAFETLEELQKHKSSKCFICELCMKSFGSKNSLITHKKKHDEGVISFHCSHCDKIFVTQQQLSQHKKSHAKERPFVCEYCKKTFATKHNLEAHNITHTGVKPYTCTTCNKSFARKTEKIDHERIHAGLRPFKCEYCEASFTQRSNLTSHKKLTHFNQSVHKCDLCDRSFKRRRLLEYHKNAVHTGERPYRCDKCPSSFVYKEHFKKHLIIHTGEKPFPCEVCGKRFNSRDNRNAHRFVHSDKKPYECVTCGAGFMRKPLLLTHMKHSRHINDTIIVNQPQINGGVLQTTTEIVQTTEETVGEPIEMIVDHLEETTQLRSIKMETVYLDDERKKEDALKHSDEIYKNVSKIDESVVS